MVVSVRDEDFRPISGAAVDVFWTTADRADRALSIGGACSLPEVTRADLSSFACEIDDTDPVTGNDGDAAGEVIGLRRVPAGGAAVWAWAGSDGDTVAAGSELYRFEVAEGADVRFRVRDSCPATSATQVWWRCPSASPCGSWWRRSGEARRTGVR